MKILDKIKKLSMQNKIVFLIILFSIIVSVFAVIIVKVRKNNTIEVNNNLQQNVLEIPGVNEQNTKINISTLEGVENVTIKIDEKLVEYNLYYLVESLENTEELKDKNDYTLYSLYENDIILTENSKVYFIYEKDKEYSKDIYEINIDNIIETLQEEVPQEQIEKEKVDKKDKKNYTSKYYIKVNYGANVVTIYTKDENGDYTVPVKAMVCSSGISTPKSGVYKTSKGYKWGTLIGGVYGMYSTRIVRNILFHSVPYTAPRNDALEYWEFDKLGTKASAGCIRLMVKDAKWIFNNCEAGTMVEFYSDSNPGPLGKPSAPKISNNEMCRNWDPTDDTEGNPWLLPKEDENNKDIVEDKDEIINNDNKNPEVEDTSKVEPPEDFDDIITDDTILTD